MDIKKVDADTIVMDGETFRRVAVPEQPLQLVEILQHQAPYLTRDAIARQIKIGTFVSVPGGMDRVVLFALLANLADYFNKEPNWHPSTKEPFSVIYVDARKGGLYSIQHKFPYTINGHATLIYFKNISDAEAAANMLNAAGFCKKA